MKPSTTSPFRTIRSHTKPHTPLIHFQTAQSSLTSSASLRYLSSSTPRSEEVSENVAESSTSPQRPGKGQSYPGESKEDAFRRNLKEVQAWRRRRESLR